MKPDTVTNTPEDAAAYEQIRGRDEWIDTRPTRAELEADERGGPVYDETKLCDRCEHGHGGHVCAWCSGAAS